jgi:hypothetical protein
MRKAIKFYQRKLNGDERPEPRARFGKANFRKNSITFHLHNDAIEMDLASQGMSTHKDAQSPQLATIP